MEKKAKKKTTKKPTTKKVVAKKKSSKSIINGEVTTLDEMIKSHIYLYQYCNSMNKKLHEQEIELSTVFHQIGFLRQENMELKSLLQGLASRLKDTVEKDTRSWLDDDSSSSPNREVPKSGMPKKKMLPMHDDVSVNCETCSSIHHVNMSKCPKCGYERNKK